MILAAGLGSRLRPLTDDRPKALIEWEGRALLDHVVYKLKSAGFQEIIINVHHFADMIIEHVRAKDNYGIGIEFSREEELLDTGGGLARAAWFLKDAPFLVYNVDILCSIDLQALMQAHIAGGAIATMAVKERQTSRSLLMTGNGMLGGWRNNVTGEEILVGDSGHGLHPIAFSAIHVMNPEIFDYFPPEEKFPVMHFYLELARQRPVKLYRHDQDTWLDLGRKEVYNKQAD